MREMHFSRNPKIAEFLHEYSYVQEFGEGVDRIYREMSDAGLPNPEYTLNSFLLTASIKNAPVNAPVKFNATQTQILQLIENNERINILELTEALGKDRRTITRNIKALKEAGVIARIGSDKTGYWKIIK